MSVEFKPCFKQSLNYLVLVVNYPNMRAMRRLLLAILASLAATGGGRSAEAQMPDLVEMSAQYLPNAPLEDPRPTEVQVTSYDVAMNVPLPLGESTFLIPGAAYHVDSVSFHDAPADFIELRAFHAVDVPLLFVQLLPRDWALSVRVAPGLAGDFLAVDSRMVRINALAMATHGFSDELVVGGGGMTSYAFGSLLPLPVAYVEWKPSPRWSVEAFLPAFVRTRLSLWDRLELGYGAEVQGNAYAVRDRRVDFDHVAYSVIAAGPTLGVRLFETVWWNVFAGHSVYRRFDLLDRDDEAIPGGVQQLPNRWLVRSGIAWRIPME